MPNPSAQMVSYTHFYPFGETLESWTSGVYNQFLYTGKERDQHGAFDYYYFGARYYDTKTGTFTSYDKASQFPGGFRYGNNPIIGVDRDGNLFGIDAFVVGFFSALFKGNNPFEEGSKRFWNDVKIWGGLLQTDSNRPWYARIWQGVSRLTWQLPQTTLGIGVNGTINTFGGVESVSYGYGATLVETRWDGTKKEWGFTLGSYITVSKGTTVRSPLFQHEYGHYLQSERVGLFYLPFVATPSLYDGTVSTPEVHNEFWTETWADRLAETYFSDDYQSFPSGNTIPFQGETDVPPKSNLDRIRYMTLSHFGDNIDKEHRDCSICQKRKKISPFKLSRRNAGGRDKRRIISRSQNVY
jgi:RHS repeat-associated protein